MKDSRNSSIEFNEILIRRIVYSVNKAITEDILSERRLETNNRCRLAPGDYINENLRQHVVNDDIYLIPFKRFVFEGRILVDKINKITYTITTLSTLAAGPKKHGRKPYYMQSILCMENGECEGSPKQMTLADYAESVGLVPFTEDDFENDFNDIMQGIISKNEGYRHYIIAYSVENKEIKEIKLLYLDKDFAEVDSADLMEYVTPDFVALTNSNYVDENTHDEEEKHGKPFKLRPGVKFPLRAKEEEV
ncbi:MAG: DUF5986 family protein [Lachnospiraceae bacterium]|nr:DUF5986 family protein [Lachnospiraceae bacterium]